VTAAGERRLVLVVGVGRSGTSLIAGILGQLGLHIPQPEVRANETNPRGFGEPRWVVDFHTRLLEENQVTVNDARPAAWEKMAPVAEDPAVLAELRGWLGAQLAAQPALVVKDPRTAWLLPLWLRCAQDLGVPTSFVTMLRPPTETVASAVRSYGSWQTAASRAGAWVNIGLETERATRGHPRAFIRYSDLLGDWRRELARVAAPLELPGLAAPEPARANAADAFVDPQLHRSRIGWEQLEEPVPASVRELADRAWSALQALARDGGDDAAARAALDATRAAYRTLYAEAESLAQSTVTAARKRAEARAPALYVSLARRIPERHRARLRRLLGA
jgi:hypothetical protein